MSPSKRSKAPSVTVNVSLASTNPVSLSATGASLTPTTVIIKVAVSEPPPFETV